MKNILIIFFFFLLSLEPLSSSEKIFSIKKLSNLYMEPNLESPIVYPVELGKEMVLKKSEGIWLNVVDEKTGLIGWVSKEDYSSQKPEKKTSGKNYEESFKIFKENVLQMSTSIKEAIAVETFTDVKHLGGAAAIVIADDMWFLGRRHANQAFQVYELWRGQNQSPSFLSFRDSKGEEKFIIVSGPNRPRYLKSIK